MVPLLLNITRIGTILSAVLGYKTLKGNCKVKDRRKKRRERRGIL
jgi:hypothetical protein